MARVGDAGIEEVLREGETAERDADDRFEVSLDVVGGSVLEFAAWDGSSSVFFLPSPNKLRFLGLPFFSALSDSPASA